ncbi:hypothetical protein CsSME_00002914 [Camellia sinensis var. sinensis]
MTVQSLRPTILFCYLMYHVIKHRIRLSSIDSNPIFPVYCITFKQAFGNHGLLAGYDTKPIEVGLGCERVVSKHDAMENTRNVNETKSSDARIAQLERMFNKMKPPTFQGGLEPLKVKAWILETEKLFEVFPCSEAQKGKAMVDAHSGQQWFYDLGSIQGGIL